MSSSTFSLASRMLKVCVARQLVMGSGSSRMPRRAVTQNRVTPLGRAGGLGLLGGPSGGCAESGKATGWDWQLLKYVQEFLLGAHTVQ